MVYNRWLTPENPYDYSSSELYHHGVKGMKWGKHIFGQGAIQIGSSGGGAAETDPELAELAEKYKKGLISASEFKTAKAKIDAKRIQEKANNLANNARNLVSRKRNITENGTGVQLRGSAAKKKTSNGNSFYEKNKDKMNYTVGDMDLDARKRRYTAEGRDRYRKNGKYRNMNLTDVYGENAKVKDRSGYRGKNLFKDIDVDDIHDGKNYATREVNVGGVKWKSKDNDGRYDLRDKVREKITGAADDDHLISTYKDYVKNYDRRADQTHAWSVGLEEEHIRNQARKHTDSVEQKIYDKSLAGTLKRITSKKRRRW